MKWIRRIAVVLLILIVVAAAGLYLSIDGLIRAGVVTGTTAVTGTPTGLEGAHLALIGGSGLTLTDLTIANPQGFTEPTIFRLGSGEVQLSLGSLLSDTVVVPKVALDGMTVTVEGDFTQGLKLNLTALKNQMAGGGSPDTKETSKSVPNETPDRAGEVSEGEGSKKFVLELLTVTNTRLDGRVLLPDGTSQDLDLKLADIRIEGIGQKNNGVVLREALEPLVNKLLEDAIKAVSTEVGISREKLEAEATKALKKEGNKAIDDTLKKQGIEGEDADAIKKGLGDLFGSKKKQPTE